MRKMRFVPVVALWALAATLPAHATLIIDGGSSGEIPRGASNQVIGGDWDGYFGGTLLTDGSHQLRFEFIGFEAGYRNAFELDLGGWTMIFYTEHYASNQLGTIAAPIGDLFEALFAAGAIPFRFSINGSSHVTNDGTNPDDALGGAGINYFMSFGNSAARSGSSIYIFLDDAGAGPDDNHDDMVVRITEVPEPGTLTLLGLGLLGLGAVQRRRSR